MNVAAQACIAIALPWRDPLVAFAPLSQEPYALLLGPGGENAGRWTILLARPQAVYERSGPGALQSLPTLPKVEANLPLPFVGGYAGLASYELGASFDKVPRKANGRWPDIAFGDYPCAAVFDHRRKAMWAVGPDGPSAERFAQLLGETPLLPMADPVARRLEKQETRKLCESKVARVRDYIHAGDIFQANISQGFRIELDAQDNAFSYFRRLCAQSPAPFSGFFRRDKDQVLLSNSPERFFTLQADGHVQTSPIKGTRPRGADPAQDRALAEALLQSAKDRAENLMIVDLMRNDLSRVCVPGSVRVPALFALETYANVHHLVSTINGQLRPGADARDVLVACFPAGSITGAPKVRAMEIITELEAQPRGPYCGSLGYISAHGGAQFNVLIRSAEHRTEMGKSWLSFRTGGGIVADSDPALEYQEMLDKAGALRCAAGAE